MTPLKLEVEGRIRLVYAQKLGPRLWFHFDGRTYCYEPERKGRRSGKQAKTDPGSILAPMPGKVTKVEVQQGQSVRAQEVVLIMEAMKMEYTLKAEIEGKVVELNCDEGDQVNLGQVLARVEESK